MAPLFPANSTPHRPTWEPKIPAGSTSTRDPYTQAALAATDPSLGETLPWNYDPPVLCGLVIFLAVALTLFMWNAFALHRMRAIRVRDKLLAADPVTRPAAPIPPGSPATTAASTVVPVTRRPTIRRAAKSRAPGAPWWTKSRLARLQLFAAAMHVANQINFLVQHLGRNMNCPWVGTVSAVLYALMIFPSSSVLILRSTMLVPAWRRTFKRTVLFALMAVAMGLIAASNALRTWDQDLLAVGVCQIKYERTLNTAGKAALVIMYFIILIVLVRPMVRHVLEMRKMRAPGMRRDEHSRRLESVVLMLLLKIVMAIFLVTLGSILGFFNVFGRFFALEFSLQNCGTVYASTLALDRLRTSRTGSSGESASRSTGGGAHGASGPTTDQLGTDSWSNSIARRVDPATPKLLGSSMELHPMVPSAANSPLRINLSAAETAAAVAKLMGPSLPPPPPPPPMSQPPGEKAGSRRVVASSVSVAPSSGSATRVPSSSSSSAASSRVGVAPPPQAPFAGHQLIPNLHRLRQVEAFRSSTGSEVEDDGKMRRIASGVWIDEDEGEDAEESVRSWRAVREEDEYGEDDESDESEYEDDLPLRAQTRYVDGQAGWATAPDFAGAGGEGAHVRRPTVEDEVDVYEEDEDAEARRVRRPLTR
ncbi:hypothetical protein GGF32_000679 [Allomyces javanicus]|nr:hypothetical protein GGF32_000679 [Allomyces javanicus]